MWFQLSIINFHLQYTLTIATIVLIPLLLWLGKDGTPKPVSKKALVIITRVIFIALIIADLVAYFLLGHIPSYLYLAIITLLSLVLVRKSS